MIIANFISTIRVIDIFNVPIPGAWIRLPKDEGI